MVFPEDLGDLSRATTLASGCVSFHGPSILATPGPASRCTSPDSYERRALESYRAFFFLQSWACKRGQSPTFTQKITATEKLTEEGG
jgi:hypothetical protein